MYIYRVYNTGAELLAALQMEFKPTSHLALTCRMNFQTSCAEKGFETDVETQPGSVPAVASLTTPHKCCCVPGSQPHGRSKKGCG